MQEHIVQLDTFQGPLDLLLFLIRRDELDIHDIPIARVTEQFLVALEGMTEVDIDAAGEFLVMAATLMEIKSRMLEREAALASGREASATRERSEEGEDPRASLVEQLLAYKTYRDAADVLDKRWELWSSRTTPSKAGVDPKLVREAIGEPDALDLDDIALIDLVRAFEGVLDSVNFDRLGEHEVLDDDTPIELHAADLIDLLQRAEAGAPDPGARDETGESLPVKVTFASLLAGRTRGAMIGVFLALLELVRQQRVSVSRDESAPLGDPGALLVALRPHDPDAMFSSGPDGAAQPPQPEADA